MLIAGTTMLVIKMDGILALVVYFCACIKVSLGNKVKYLICGLPWT